MSKLTTDSVVITVPKNQIGAIGTGPRQGSKERCAEDGLRDIDGVVDVNTHSWGAATTVILTVQLDCLDQKERICTEANTLLHQWYGVTPMSTVTAQKKVHHPV